MKRILFVLVSSVFIIWLVHRLYRGLDVGVFVSHLANSDPFWLSVLAAAILFEQLIQGWKWRQLLFDIKPIASLRLTGALLAGYAANVLVPVGISPLVRSWLVARMEHLQMPTVLVTALISRFIDGIVFGFIALAAALTISKPSVLGNLNIGLLVAGIIGLSVFSSILWLLYSQRMTLRDDRSRVSIVLDWVVRKSNGRLTELRQAVAAGIIWPQSRLRQFAVLVASLAMKAIGATHFVWAGLAVGLVLSASDYLFVFVFAGFALVLARFVRIPGGFVVGSAFAFKLLGVADEQAAAMILFVHAFTIILVVGIGLLVLWVSGVQMYKVRNLLDLRDRQV